MSLFSSVELSEDTPTNVLELLESAADHGKIEQWEIALTLSTNALEELENALGSNSRDVGLILSIVGSINSKVDKYDEAERIWKRAISILEKYDGESDSVDTIRWKLIKLLTEDRRFEEAVVLMKQAIEVYENRPKIDLSVLYRRKMIIGKFYLHLKKPDEAKKYLSAVLSLYVKLFGTYRFQYAEIFELLEAAFFFKNNIIESKQSFENSSGIAGAISLCSLGMLYENAKLYFKAIVYYLRAVEIYGSKEFLDNSKLADINLKLGKCYLEIGNYLDSQFHLEKSCVIYEKTLANDDPVMIDVRIHLAICCVKTAKFDEARKIYEEILGNVYTDERNVSILEWARSSERSGKDKVPILNEKRNLIVPVLWDLSALYILDRNYRIAKILQNFAESQPDLTEHNGI